MYLIGMGVFFFTGLHRTKTSKEDEAPKLKNLAKKQNAQQSSENATPNRNHSSELEILQKKQKVQELSENKKLKKNPEKILHTQLIMKQSASYHIIQMNLKVFQRSKSYTVGK